MKHSHPEVRFFLATVDWRCTGLYDTLISHSKMKGLVFLYSDDRSDDVERARTRLRGRVH